MSTTVAAAPPRSSRSRSISPTSSSTICAGASRRRGWPTKELVDDRSQGVQLATIQALARYWANDYDFRASRRG